MIFFFFLSRLAMAFSFHAVCPTFPHLRHPLDGIMRKTSALNHHRQDAECSTCNQRRSLLMAPIAFFLSTSQPTLAKEDKNEEGEDILVYQLTSGLQVRNLRQGSGPVIRYNSGTSNENENDEYSNTVVLHLRAMTSDGVPLLDSYETQKPILYDLGTSQNFDVFGGDSSKRPQVTQGVEDAILSRGTTSFMRQNGVSSSKNSRLEAMREGGIRRVIVPSSLAYGHKGVSRYDAFRMGLKNPVPRDQDLLYDVEVLRCSTIQVDVPSSPETTTATVPNRRMRNAQFPPL